MKTKRINGTQFEKMVRNALENLRSREQELNDLNVFPVPDGDTGTNMRLTLEHGITNAKRSTALGGYLRSLSSGMLLGARGNSGVILSQIFKGIYLHLARCIDANANDFCNAFALGYKTAYQAVVCPVEGTILTVAREGVEHIRRQIDRRTDMETLLSVYIAEMRKSLSYTPELLAVLKEAGVVDSGASGYILIVDGMLKYLYGERIHKETAVETQAAQAPARSVAGSRSFNENSTFDDGYCMEYILQLMKAERYTQRFRLEAYIEDLKLYGNSIVATQEGTRVKVHIHTLRPAKVIAASQEYGEFLTFKLENMQLQHNGHIEAMQRKRERTAFSVLTVVNGDGMKDLFAALGCKELLDGGETMNVSSEEFLRAYREANAEVLAVLPNNKNAVLAAKQAASMFGEGEVVIIPTASVMEGYFALSMDIQDSTDTAMRIRQIQRGATSVTTLSLTTATRDCTGDSVVCAEGNRIALLNDAIVAAEQSFPQTAVNGLHRVAEISEKETCLVLRGRDVPQEAEAELESSITAHFPGLEVSFVDGGQPIYPWLIGVI